MKTIIGKHLVIYFKMSIILGTLVAMLYGCAATKPNLSIIDTSYIPPRGSETDENFLTVKSILTEISSRNELLAIELGKLPELQDGVSIKEKYALENVANFHNKHQAIFDKAFGEMHEAGIPEVRKYCSPLQAFFWLAEDRRLSEKNNPLVNYSLENLLREAWNFDFGTYMSEKQIHDIVNGIIDKNEKKQYLENIQRRDKGLIQIYLLNDYKWKPEIFSEKVKKIIKSLIRNPRWQSFSIVAERLNAPELIDYYERTSRMHWVDWRTLPSPSVSPWYVFKYKKGDCVSITGFTIHCLRKGGYKAQEIRVSSPSGKYPFHAVCLFKQHGEKYIMDNGRSSKMGIVPYERYMRYYK